MELQGKVCRVYYICIYMYPGKTTENVVLNYLLDILGLVDWQTFGEHVYFFSETLATWSQANQTCASIGAALACINSEEEHMFMRGIAAG